jgi:hypothetical protein
LKLEHMYRFINAGGEAQGTVIAEPGAPITLNYGVSYIIVSQGASPNFTLHERLTLVVPQDELSDPHVSHEQLRVSCTP